MTERTRSKRSSGLISKKAKNRAAGIPSDADGSLASIIFIILIFVMPPSDDFVGRGGIALSPASGIYPEGAFQFFRHQPVQLLPAGLQVI